MMLVGWLTADVLKQGSQGRITRNGLRNQAVLSGVGPSSQQVCGDSSGVLCSVLAGSGEDNCCHALYSCLCCEPVVLPFFARCFENDDWYMLLLCDDSKSGAMQVTCATLLQWMQVKPNMRWARLLELGVQHGFRMAVPVPQFGSRITAKVWRLQVRLTACGRHLCFCCHAKCCGSGR